MSTKYLLPCTCGERLPVDAAQAGQQVRCPCGAELEVPTLLQLKQLVAVAPLVGARRRPIAWGPRQAVMLLGAILAVLGISWAAWCLAARPRFVANRLAPWDALNLWERLKAGIDTPPAAVEDWMENVRQYGNLRAGAGWVVAVIGALMLIGALAIPGPNRESPRTPDS